MLNENAKTWINALKSGEFKQTRHLLTRLSSDGSQVVGHCCLGVACELAMRSGVSLQATDIAGSADQGVANASCRVYNNCKTALPQEVQDWLGLKDRVGSISAIRTNDARSLANMNDFGIPFSQIADFIKSEPEGLFRNAQ
jgi:hypothetical protein